MFAAFAQIQSVSLFDGMDVTNIPMYQRARRGMGYLSQEPSIFQRLSVRDNLLAVLETMNLSKRQREERAEQLLEQFGLLNLAEHEARTLSGGERRKLEIARAMVTDPSLILLDEPFSGVDPIAVEDLQHQIRQLVAAGVSLLITDHNVRETLDICDRAYIVSEGSIIAEGRPESILENQQVRDVYLGHQFKL